VTVSTTKVVRALLAVIVKDGTYGKNAAEVANVLLQEKIRELEGAGDFLAENLRKVHRRLYGEDDETNNPDMQDVGE
jgi:hypothetical protein